MRNFYIESVSVSGEGKITSSVTFQDGINIVMGDSDTGKTKIIMCILFAMGGSHKPFAKKCGYDTVSLTIMTARGRITFERGYEKNTIHVKSENDDIESGIYHKDFDRGQPSINTVWLRIMGIENQPRLPFNKCYERRRLTWNNLVRIFCVDEREIGRETSILEPVQYTERTLLLSALLFLIYGQDFSDKSLIENAKLHAAKRQAVEEFILQSIHSLSERQSTIAVQLASSSDFVGQDEIDSIVNSIETTNKELANAAEESKSLLKRILATEEKKAENDLLISRYEILESQYKSDLRRLSFIADGEQLLKHAPHGHRCPVCHSELPEQETINYVNAVKTETQRIVSLLRGLKRTQEQAMQKRQELIDKLDELRIGRTGIESLIHETLTPKAENLKLLLSAYIERTQLLAEENIIKEYSEKWEKQLVNNEKTQTKEDFRPKEYFDANFQRTMSEYASSILNQCNYPYSSVSFNLSTFDIEVDNGIKKEDHGKGYCAFLNTVVLLMLRKYLAEYGAYMPGITIIDSPLHGMYQGVEDGAPESLKTGLFEYFCTTADEGQLIIVENTEHVPDLVYKRPNVNVIRFSKNMQSERHGFFLDFEE